MPVGAGVAIAGAGLASGAMGASASKKAGAQVAASTDRAAELQNQQFEKLLALQMPGYQRGEAAASLYARALGIPMPNSPQPHAGYPTGGMMTGGYGVASGGAGYSGGPQMQLADAGTQDYSVGPSMRLMTGGSYTSNPGAAPPPQQVPLGPEAASQPPQTQPSEAQSIADMVRATPGYQGQLDQGLKAIDRAAPLVGGMYSGRRMKALNDYGQNTFSGFYADWMNRVGGMAGQGAQAAQNIGQAGMNNAANVGNLMMTGARAQAQGTVNSANAWSGAIGDAVGAGMWVGGKKGWF